MGSTLDTAVEVPALRTWQRGHNEYRDSSRLQNLVQHEYSSLQCQYIQQPGQNSDRSQSGPDAAGSIYAGRRPELRRRLRPKDTFTESLRTLYLVGKLHGNEHEPLGQ